MKKLSVQIKKFSFLIFFFYVTLLIMGSLWPRITRHYQTGEISSGLIPLEGDNFKMVNIAAVYHLQEGKRRKYTSDTSFYNYQGNKDFDTPYKDGGILICDKKTVFSFPMGDFMPFKPGGVGKKFNRKSFGENFVEALFRKDKVKHFFAYAFFAILLFILLQKYSPFSDKINMFIIFVSGTLLGGGIEFLQFEFIPGRDKELLDLLLNSIGLIGGVVLYQKYLANLLFTSSD